MFLKSVEKTQVPLKSGNYNVHLTWRSMYIYGNTWINFSDNERCLRKKVAEEKTHILCSITFSENRAIYEMMWKNMVEPERPQITIRRMRTASWITNVTDTHSEYVILIAFPLQQRLRERASVSRHTYIACLVNFCNNAQHFIRGRAQRHSCNPRLPIINAKRLYKRNH
jgi:hypothetical protein